MVRRRVVCEVCRDTGHDFSFGQPCTDCNFLPLVAGVDGAIRQLKLEPTLRARKMYLEAAALCDRLSSSSVMTRVWALRPDPLAENLGLYRSPGQKVLDDFRRRFGDVRAYLNRLGDDKPVRRIPEVLWLQAVTEVAAELQDLEDRSTAVRQMRGRTTRYRNSRSTQFHKTIRPRFTRMDRVSALKRNGLVPISYIGHWSVPILGACTTCKSEAYFPDSEIRSRQAKCQVCVLTEWWRLGNVQEFRNYCLRHLKLNLQDLVGDDSSELVGECARCSSSCEVSLALVVTGRIVPCTVCSEPNWGVVYLARHNESGALKIGRSTSRSFRERARDHTSRGWQIVEMWQVGNRAVAEEVEAQVLSYVRHHLELDVAMPEDVMPQGGYSETFPGSCRRIDDVGADVIGFVNNFLGVQVQDDFRKNRRP